MLEGLKIYLHAGKENSEKKPEKKRKRGCLRQASCGEALEKTMGGGRGRLFPSFLRGTQEGGNERKEGGVATKDI